MDNPLPDSAGFYTSPHPLEVQAAIGRFITLWAGVETSLVLQVARLVASDIATGETVASAIKLFHHNSYLKAVAVGIGTPARATTTQLQNLALDREDELKRACDVLLKVKEKRDTIAHSTGGARDNGLTHFHGLQASRAKMGTDKVYSVSEIDNWCCRLQEAARQIDDIVTDITGWSWKRIREDQLRWQEARRALGERIQDIPLGPGIAPEATDPEDPPG